MKFKEVKPSGLGPRKKDTHALDMQGKGKLPEPGEHYGMTLDHGIDLTSRTIYLFDDIEFFTVSKIAKGINIMQKQGNIDPISLYIGSFGGCPYAALWLYDFIKAQKEVKIHTYVCGAAMSAGSIIFMAGHKRFMYSHSRLMLHSVISYTEGKVFVSLVPDAEECKEIYKNMCNIYADNSNQDYKTWYRWLKYEDKYFNAERAIELGLVDTIVK